MTGWDHAAALAHTAISAMALLGLQASALALVGLFVVRAGRVRPAWQAAVWLVVLAKFVLPWSPALAWSLADLIAALRHHGDAAPLVLSPAAAIAPAVAPSLAWLVVAAIWLVGAARVGARSIVAHQAVAQAARQAAPAPAHARALLARLAARPPRLVVGAPTVGPHVVGLLRPIIVVPPVLVTGSVEDTALLRAALLHELAHVRRADALGRAVQVLAGAVFFFWPVVRAVNRRLDLAREAACDAWAIEQSGVDRPAYARLLVRMAQLRTADAATGLAARRGIDARVAAVLDAPARARLGLAHGAGLIAWICVALGGARSAEARGDHQACRYTPALAEALRQAHPEADLDGDGVLSRDEACEFQAELRRRTEAAPGADQVSRLDPIDEDLLTEPLCCNREPGAENSAPSLDPRTDACQLR